MQDLVEGLEDILGSCRRTAGRDADADTDSNDADADALWEHKLWKVGQQYLCLTGDKFPFWYRNRDESNKCWSGFAGLGW